MFSRMTHVVLLIAVAVLAAALLRVSQRSSISEARSMNDAAALSTLADVEHASLLLAGDVFESDAAVFALAAVPQNDAAPGLPQTDAMLRDRSDAPRGEGRSDWHGERSRSGGGGSGGGGPRMDDEQVIARCLEVAREVDDELADRLIDARQKNPDEFDRQMRAGGFGRRLFALAMLKSRDPILYGQKVSELTQAVQIERVAKQLRALRSDANASMGDAAAKEAELHQLLVVQFASSMKAKGDLLCRFEERAAELRREIERDASNFQNIIDARMKALAAEPPAQPVLESRDAAGDKPAAERSGSGR